MDINATLFGQMITFALLVWFTMRFVWPPLIGALEERRGRIAEGLSAAEQGHKALQEAREITKIQIQEAQEKAQEIIAQAHRYSSTVLEEAKQNAAQEYQRIVGSGYTEVQQAQQRARLVLQGEICTMALTMTERLLGHAVNEADAKYWLDAERCVRE